MRRDPNCIFCKIIGVEVPASVVYEDDAVIAFLDVNPLADGHLLVVPREHFTRVDELPPGTASALFGPIPRLGKAVCEVNRVKGYNVLVNTDSVAGQAVPHVHCHLIPRRDGDGLGYRWNAGKYEEGRADSLAAAYQQALSRHD